MTNYSKKDFVNPQIKLLEREFTCPRLSCISACTQVLYLNDSSLEKVIIFLWNTTYLFFLIRYFSYSYLGAWSQIPLWEPLIVIELSEILLTNRSGFPLLKENLSIIPDLYLCICHHYVFIISCPNWEFPLLKFNAIHILLAIIIWNFFQFQTKSLALLQWKCRVYHYKRKMCASMSWNLTHLEEKIFQGSLAIHQYHNHHPHYSSGWQNVYNLHSL